MNRGGLTGKFKPYIFLKIKFLVAGFTVVYVMFKTRAVSDLNSFKNVPLVFYFNRILNNALKKEKAVKITKATLVKYYANRLNNPSTQRQGREGRMGATQQSFIRGRIRPVVQPFTSFYIPFLTQKVPLTGK